MTFSPNISLSSPLAGYGVTSGYGAGNAYGLSRNQTTTGQGLQAPSGPAQTSGPESRYPADPSQDTAQTPGLQAESQDESQGNTENPSQTSPDGSRLTAEELQLVEELKAADLEVRQHEMAHLAAGGSLVTSGASFTYKTGPDGQRYAVAGEVGIDVSAVPGDPRATIEKMQQIKRAATAPASPSAQDLRVAAKATATAAEAAGELTMLMAKQQASKDEAQAFGSPSQAADAYQKVSSLPEGDTSTFQLAV